MLCLIPYLAIPLILPDLTTGMRLLAFLAAFAISGYQLFLNTNREALSSPRISPFHGVILLGTILLYFSINDPWYRHIVWPTAVCGVLLLLSTALNNKTPIFLGTLLSGFLFAGLAVLYEYNSSLFFHNIYSDTVSHAYPSASLILDSGITLPAAIRLPNSYIYSLLLQISSAIGTTLAVLLSFLPAFKRYPISRWLPLSIWITISFPLIGRDLFLLTGILVILFTSITSHSHQLITWNSFLKTIVFGIFCLAGYLGSFDGLAIWIQQSILLIFNSFPTPVSISMIGTLPPNTLFYGDGKMGTDWLVPAVIGGGFLFLIVETGLNRKKDDLRYPTGISLLLLTGLSIGPTVNTWLIHPLTWIAMACLQNAHRIEKPDSSSIPSSRFDRRLTLQVLMGMTCILGIMTLWNLVPNWRSEQELNRFRVAILEGDRNDSVVKAYSRTPYRGDMAALCATESIMIFFPQIALPPSPEPGKWEYLMRLGAKYGYTPLLGNARLSGLYFLLSQGERSMDVLAMAVEISPNEIILHELLADMLDTVGRKEQAMEHYRICANLDPSASRIRGKMARLYLSQGKKEEANIEWNKLLTLDPTQKPSMP